MSENEKDEKANKEQETRANRRKAKALPRRGSAGAGNASSRDDGANTRFLAVCKEIRELTDTSGRNVIRIADLMIEAKKAYERKTGTGHGKRRKSEDVPSFGEAVARATGLDPSLIRRYCRIAALDAASKAPIAKIPKLAGNLTLLYVLVGLDAEVRHEAIDAFESGGKSAMEAAIERADAAAQESDVLRVQAAADPDLGRFLTEINDPTTALGALPATYQIAAMKNAPAFLSRFQTVDDVRRAAAALEQPLKRRRKKTTRGRSKMTSGPESTDATIPVKDGVGEGLFLGVHVRVVVLADSVRLTVLGATRQEDESGTPASDAVSLPTVSEPSPSTPSSPFARAPDAEASPSTGQVKPTETAFTAPRPKSVSVVLAPGGLTTAHKRLASLHSARTTAAHLIVTRDACAVRWQRGDLITEARLAVERIEGEGALALPVRSAGVLSLGPASGSIRATDDGGAAILSIDTPVGTLTEPSTWVDGLGTLRMPSVATQVPAGVLKETLAVTTSFTRAAGGEGKRAAVFTLGNGAVSACDGRRGVHLSCKALTFEEMTCPSEFTSAFGSFLATTRTVTVGFNDGRNVVADADGNAMAWPASSVAAPVLKGRRASKPECVLSLSPNNLALAAMYTMASVDVRRATFMLVLDDGTLHLTGETADARIASGRFPVTTIGAATAGAWSVQIKDLLALVKDCKAPCVEFRIAQARIDDEGTFLIWTVEHFRLSDNGTMVKRGGHECVVTRFMPTETLLHEHGGPSAT